VRLLVVLLLLAAVAAAALPIDDGRPARGVADEPGRSATDEPGRGATDEPGRGATDEPGRGAADDVPRARCPAAVTGCRSVRGSVLYVERVDPDGDGDLHVVVLDGSITAPGVTAVDVRPALRPPRAPRPGERVSAAGPVQRGSYGQSQIHALEFHTRGG
jgi:hypothetical protein